MSFSKTLKHNLIVFTNLKYFTWGFRYSTENCFKSYSKFTYGPLVHFMIMAQTVGSRSRDPWCIARLDPQIIKHCQTLRPLQNALFIHWVSIYSARPIRRQTRIWTYYCHRRKGFQVYNVTIAKVININIYIFFRLYQCKATTAWRFDHELFVYFKVKTRTVIKLQKTFCIFMLLKWQL